MEVIGLDQIEDALSDLKIVEKSVIKVEHCFSFMTYVLNIPIKVKVNKINIKRYCHLCLFVYINIDINTHTHTHTHTHAHIHTHTHMHACMHARTHAHAHNNIHLSVSILSSPVQTLLFISIVCILWIITTKSILFTQ